MQIPKEVSKLIQGSGNNFHARVARWLSASDWLVLVSPYYMDQTQNKAREIDLIAEKRWPIPDLFGRTTGFVAVRLFIECKFVPSHSVFWFADKDRDSAETLVCRSGAFSPNNTYTNKHHYLVQSPKVAKLFATSTTKSQEADPFYKALNQALNAMVSMRGRLFFVPAPKPKVIIDFPVVVCNSFDQFYAVDFHTEAPPKRIEDNFQLELRYAYIDRGIQADDYFLVDFVEFSQLEKFGQAMNEDAKAAATLAAPR